MQFAYSFERRKYDIPTVWQLRFMAGVIEYIHEQNSKAGQVYSAIKKTDSPNLSDLRAIVQAIASDRVFYEISDNNETTASQLQMFAPKLIIGENDIKLQERNVIASLYHNWKKKELTFIIHENKHVLIDSDQLYKLVEDCGVRMEE